jgi:hypothetical protein
LLEQPISNTTPPKVQVLMCLKREGGASEIKVIDQVIKLVPWLLGQIIKLTHVDIPAGSHIFARATVKTGYGIDAGICLGWKDTKGFHMVGVRGKVGVMAKIGGDLMAGLHHDRRRVRAVIGVGNAVLEFEFKLQDKAATGIAGGENEYVLMHNVPEAPPEDVAEAPPPGVLA